MNFGFGVDKCKSVYLYNFVDWDERNLYLNFEAHVLTNLDKPWRWDYLSENLNIDFEKHVLRAYADKPWDWNGLSENPIIDIEKHVIKYPKLPWDWTALSFHSKIDFEKHVLQHLDKPWDWTGLSANPNITMEHVLKYFPQRGKLAAPSKAGAMRASLMRGCLPRQTMGLVSVVYLL